MESYYKIMSYYPPLPRKINPQIPEVLEEIAIHAMEKQKEKRYASMKEFSDALKEYLSDTTVKPTPQYAQIKKRLWIERNKNKVIASCIVALLAIVFVIIVSILGKQTQLTEFSPEKTPTVTLSILKEKQAKLQNDAETQYQLGLMYEKGEGVKQDYNKARKYYEQSAKLGHIEAQFNLGWMYYKGKGVEKDYAKAIYWFQKAKESNDPEISQRAITILEYMEK